MLVLPMLKIVEVCMMYRCLRDGRVRDHLGAVLGCTIGGALSSTQLIQLHVYWDEPEHRALICDLGV